MSKRVFLIVLDSFGIGAMPDAAQYGDAGTNTLKSISKSEKFRISNLKKLGLFNIDGVNFLPDENNPVAAYGRINELSGGKDTTTGHWEMAGIITREPFPVYPEGFPKEIIDEFTAKTGRGVLCNKPYSGTEVIKDYGEEHLKTGKLIVYTSADSVFQIAANEEIVPVEELYSYCRIAREILTGRHGVGRVIARPFVGESRENFTRTAKRHDFSLKPTGKTILDCISEAGLDTISVGKIYDIFAGTGIKDFVYTSGNTEGMEKTLDYIKGDFGGLCFTNLVDFDMLYGHRNNVDGYADALSEFDCWLSDALENLREDDLLVITADHGCDPGYTVSTDHSREAVPVLYYSKKINPVNLGTENGFCNIGKTVCDYLGVENDLPGQSDLGKIL